MVGNREVYFVRWEKDLGSRREERGRGRISKNDQDEICMCTQFSRMNALVMYHKHIPAIQQRVSLLEL